MLSAGTKNVLGVAITLRANGDSSMQIERIEVPEEKRRKGLASAALIKLADIARSQGVDLSASIYPDSDTKNFEVTDGLRRAFSRAGFTPLKMDGEIYRNDVELHCHAPSPVSA